MLHTVGWLELRHFFYKEVVDDERNNKRIDYHTFGFDPHLAVFSQSLLKSRPGPRLLG